MSHNICYANYNVFRSIPIGGFFCNFIPPDLIGGMDHETAWFL